MKILYLLSSCPETWMTRGKACLETWGKHCSDMLPDIEPYGRYKGYVENLIVFWKRVRELYPNYDWYFPANDDTYVFVNRLEKKLSTMATDLPVVFCHVKSMSIDFPSGCGMAISNLAFRAMMAYIEDGKYEWNDYSDVAFGLWFKELGIPMLHEPLFRTDRDDFTPEKLKDSYYNHYVQPDEMRDVYQKYGV